VLDLAGPLQTFHEANACGARYKISLSATSRVVNTITYLANSSVPGLVIICFLLALRCKRRCARALYWDTEDPFHYVRFQQRYMRMAKRMIY
jgi:hypothetical protein